MIRYYTNFPFFIQVYGTQVSATNDSSKMHTREWFEKEKKEKNNSAEKMKDEANKTQAELDKYKAKIVNIVLYVWLKILYSNLVNN